MFQDRVGKKPILILYVSFTVKPVFTFTNKFPTEFKWTNQPKQCTNNLTYTCNGKYWSCCKYLHCLHLPFHDETHGNEFDVLIIWSLFFVAETGTNVEFSKLEPFKDYTCIGRYNFGNESIDSDSTKVKIKCGKSIWISHLATAPHRCCAISCPRAL